VFSILPQDPDALFDIEEDAIGTCIDHPLSTTTSLTSAIYALTGNVAATSIGLPLDP
jgi:hypothetical protein